MYNPDKDINRKRFRKIWNLSGKCISRIIFKQWIGISINASFLDIINFIIIRQIAEIPVY